MFAAIGDTPYNVFLFLHILSAMIAFAPTFTHPVLVGQSRQLTERNRLLAHIAGNERRIYSPALIVTGVLGFGLAGMSDDVYNLSDPWLAAAVVIWVAMNGLLHAVLQPAEKKLAAGDASAEGRVTMGSVAISALLVIMLYLMVFQPGA